MRRSLLRKAVSVNMGVMNFSTDGPNEQVQPLQMTATSGDLRAGLHFATAVTTTVVKTSKPNPPKPRLKLRESMDWALRVWGSAEIVQRLKDGFFGFRKSERPIWP